MKRIVLLVLLAGCQAKPAEMKYQGIVGTVTYSAEDIAAQQAFFEKVQARDKALAEQVERQAADRAFTEWADSPPMMAKRMMLGRLPTYHLRSMLTGSFNPTADQVLNGNKDQTYSLGWLNNGYPATGTNVLRYVFGDLGSGIQSGNGDRMYVYAYHGVVVSGGRATTTPPAAVTGSGSSDFSLQVITSTGGGIFTNGASSFTAGLAVSGSALTSTGGFTATSGTNSLVGTLATGSSTLTVGSGGTALSFILKQTPTITFTIAASSCGDLTPGSVTGAALGGACFISAYDTSGAVNGLVALSCGQTSAAHVGIRVCNPSAGAITDTSKAYSYFIVQ